MVHALITAGKYGSAYESDAFYSGIRPSISRPRSNFNCLIIRLLPDHADTFHHYFSIYYQHFLIRLSNGGLGSREVQELNESLLATLGLSGDMCICHMLRVHLLKLHPYVSHLIDAHCVRSALLRGRLSVTVKFIAVDAAIAACTCQMHTGEDTSEIYGPYNTHLCGVSGERGGETRTPRPQSAILSGISCPDDPEKAGPRERQLLLLHRQFVFGVRGGRHARRVLRSSREKKQFRGAIAWCNCAQERAVDRGRPWHTHATTPHHRRR